MGRRNRDFGFRLLAIFAVLSVIAGCSFFRDECDETAKKIDALAKTYSGSNPDEVYAECRNALVKCPKIVSAYKLMGAIDMARKNYEGAITNYSKAFELDPKAPDTVSAIRLLSVYSVALNGNKIEISDKKITKQPCRMADITLKEYSQLDPDFRLTWLRATLDDISKKTAAEMQKKNPNVNITGSLAAYAEEVDQDILSQAEANSNGRFGEAFEKSSMNASMKHTTVGIVAK